MKAIDELRQVAPRIADWNFVEMDGAISQVSVSDLNVAGRIARDWLRLEKLVRERATKKDE